MFGVHEVGVILESLAWWNCKLAATFCRAGGRKAEGRRAEESLGDKSLEHIVCEPGYEIRLAGLNYQNYEIIT